MRKGLKQGLFVGALAGSLAFSFLALAETKGEVLFSDDFERAEIGSNWSITDDLPAAEAPSDWLVDSGELLQISNIWRSDDEYSFWQGTHIVAGSADWKDYELALDISAGDDDGIGAIVRYQDRNNYYRFIMLKDPVNKGPFRRLEKFVDGQRYVLAENQDAYEPNQVYNLVIRAVGAKLQVYLDGELVLEAQDETFKSGKVGMLSYAVTDLHIDNVKVTQING